MPVITQVCLALWILLLFTRNNISSESDLVHFTGKVNYLMMLNPHGASSSRNPIEFDFRGHTEKSFVFPSIYKYHSYIYSALRESRLKSETVTVWYDPSERKGYRAFSAKPPSFKVYALSDKNGVLWSYTESKKWLESNESLLLWFQLGLLGLGELSYILVIIYRLIALLNRGA